MQQFKEIVVGFHLAGRGQALAEATQIDPVDVQFAVLVGAGAFAQTAAIDQLIGEVHRAQFRNQGRVERDFIEPVDDLRRRARGGGARHRIDLHHQDILGIGGVQKREDRGISHVAAIPIGNAIDLDGAEHERQCSRGHDRVGGNGVSGKDAQPPGMDVGRGKEHRQTAGAHGFEVDEACNEILERVDVERIEFIGRKIARHRLEPVLHRRRGERHQREQPVGHSPLHRGQVAAGAGGAPEVREALARFVATAAGETVGNHDGVQRTGRCPGHAGDLKPLIG